MRNETLSMAYEATYLAEFRWIKAALDISYAIGFSSSTSSPSHVAISLRRREAIYARDEGRCYLCGLPVAADLRDDPWGCTIDHVRPLSHHGSRTALSNLALAHQQCNHLKGSSPHPRTIYETDHWQCQRCLGVVSRGPGQIDWHWNRPIVERLVPLSSPDIWWYGRSWTCHLRCHAYRLPIPSLILARSNVALYPSPVVDLPYIERVGGCSPLDEAT